MQKPNKLVSVINLAKLVILVQLKRTVLEVFKEVVVVGVDV